MAANVSYNAVKFVFQVIAGVIL